MKKLDLKKQLRHLYSPSKKEVVAVDVPEMNFLMVDGAGDPNTAPEFQEATEALYGVSYTLKFTMKMGPAQVDYPVMALEGLWWVEGKEQFSLEARDDWQWTLMIMQPDIITPDLVDEAVQKVKEKKDPPALARLRFEAFEEGRCAQIMHIGPYAEEGPTIQRIHEFIAEEGHKPRGRHHEIYLGDPRRTKPENLKTVLRQPFE
ncbi:MAG: GyrI-like domain-containing protein [Armatimonadota bacterium]